MPPDIPTPIRPLLDAYRSEIDRHLPSLVSAFYLHGSIALGAFDARHSDIDFIAVLSRRCTAGDLTRLASLHQALAKQYPQWPLEGSYLQWGDLGRTVDGIEPYPCCHDGVLNSGSYHDLNPVTWWVLKHRGIAWFGPPPQSLDFEVDWTALTAWMHANLNTYWVRFMRVPARIVWLFSDYGIQWAVLGVLRQAYTFAEQDITSKTGAGDYALAHLPARWHRLIREALNIRRQDDFASLYRLRALRALDAFRFLKYIIDRCNTLVD